MTAVKHDVEKLLAEGQTIQLRVPTNSMYQFIRPNRDEVIIAPLENGYAIHRGDVVLYRRPQSILVLHRVYRVTNDSFFAVGDNQSEIEGPLPLTQLRGMMVAIKRGKHTINADQPLYVLTSRLWLAMLPIRPIIWRFHRQMRKE